MIDRDYVRDRSNMKWKTSLSVYMSKKRKKRKTTGYTDMFKRVGRPRKLDHPLSTKDVDSTLSYEEDLSTEECETDTGEFSFHLQAQNSSGEKNLAGATPPPSSSPPSLSSSDVSSSSSSSETESDSDDDNNVWRSRFVRHCYAELRNADMMRNLVENLYVAGCLPDFMILVNQLASGDLSPSNIAFLLCLERAKWQSLKTTTQMRFRDVTKKFWLVVYRLLKGKGIRFFSGPKNYGQVITSEATRGNYDPKKSDINFAVPDERYLRSQDRILGRIVQPGIIEPSLNILQNHKDVVLMADCKRLAKGLKGDCVGDVDLWGHEKIPTLQDKLQKFREDCHVLSNQIKSLPNASVLQCYTNLKYTLKLVTTKIRDVREIENAERKRLLNYEKLSPDPNYKVAAKGACRSHIYDCKIFITNALELNKNICKCMSYLQKMNAHLTQST